MSNHNRFQVLAEHEDPGKLHLQVEEAPHQVAQDTRQPTLGEEGWDDDLDISEGEDSGDNDVIEDGNRRRKVSAGPRGAYTSNMPIAFPPVSTSQIVPGRGRGGGTVVRPEITIGFLPNMKETSEAEQGDKAGEATEDKDATQFMAESASPDTIPHGKQDTTFIFRAQLTWDLELGTRVNLPQFFRELVKKSSELIPDFALIPFDDEKGPVITKNEQVPDDNPTFYQDYYHNHRILNHGNMTGMVHFRCSVSWNKVKRMKEPYFQWLQKAKVYLNLAKFKSATLVVCGFLVGAHPGHLRREDAERELRERLQLSDDFPFQLSSRTISVLKDSSKEAERYSFPAVAVETSARHAKQLREAFFSQPKPKDCSQKSGQLPKFSNLLRSMLNSVIT